MKFPRDKSQYVIISGTPEGPATVFKANYVNPATGDKVSVGIKIFNDMNRIEDVYSLATQLHEAETFDHENIVKVHCSFKHEDQLWIIMSPPGVSVRSMIRSTFRQGLPEKAVGCILKETLKALHYMHGKNKLHGNMVADCVFLDENSGVKLGHSSLIYEDHHSDKSLISLEIMAYYGLVDNDKATDVWMFGLLALELFYGLQCQILASKFDEFRVLVGDIDNESRGMSIGKLGFLSCFHPKKKKKIPKLLGEVLAACLSRDPKSRPTTNQLMEYKLFHKRFSNEGSLSSLMKRMAMAM